MYCYYCKKIILSGCCGQKSLDEYEDCFERAIPICLRCERYFLNHARHPNGVDYVSIFENPRTRRFKIVPKER